MHAEQQYKLNSANIGRSTSRISDDGGRQAMAGFNLGVHLNYQKGRLSKIDSIRECISKAYDPRSIQVNSLEHLTQEISYKEGLEAFCFLTLKKQKEKGHFEEMHRFCLGLSFFKKYCQDIPAKVSNVYEIQKYVQIKTGQKGEALYHKGEPEDFFYVLVVGSIGVFKKKSSKAMSKQIQEIKIRKKRSEPLESRVNLTKVQELGFGDFKSPESFFEQQVFKLEMVSGVGRGEQVSEMAIGRQAVREHTLLFLQDSILIRIAKDRYEHILMQHQYQKLQNKLKFYQQVLFGSVRHSDLLRVVSVATKRKCIYNDVVGVKGQALRSIQVVKRGEVEAYESVPVQRPQQFKNNIIQAICTTYNKHQAHCTTRFSVQDTYGPYSMVGIQEYFRGENVFASHYRCKQATVLLTLPLELFRKMAQGELADKARAYLRNKKGVSGGIQAQEGGESEVTRPWSPCGNKKIEEHRLENNMQRYHRILDYNDRLMTDPGLEPKRDEILFDELKQLVEAKGKLKQVASTRFRKSSAGIQRNFNPQGVSQAQRLSKGIIQKISKEQKDKPRSHSGKQSDIGRIFHEAKKTAVDNEKQDYEMFQRQIDEQLNKVPHSMDQVQQIIQNIQLILVNKNLKKQYGHQLGKSVSRPRPAMSPKMNHSTFSINSRKQKNFAKFQNHLQIQRSNESFDKTDELHNFHQTDELVQVLKNIKRLNNENAIDRSMINQFFCPT